MYIWRYVTPITPYIFLFIILLRLREKTIFEHENYVKRMDLPWFSMNPSYFGASELGAKDIVEK